MSGREARVHKPLGLSKRTQETNFVSMFRVIWTTPFLFNISFPRVLKRTKPAWSFTSGVFIKEKARLISLFFIISAISTGGEINYSVSVF